MLEERRQSQQVEYLEDLRRHAAKDHVSALVPDGLDVGQNDLDAGRAYVDQLAEVQDELEVALLDVFANGISEEFLAVGVQETLEVNDPPIALRLGGDFQISHRPSLQYLEKLYH